MSVATVIVFWTFIEVVARNGLFQEVWVDPMNHVAEMVAITVAFCVLVAVAWFVSRGKKASAK